MFTRSKSERIIQFVQEILLNENIPGMSISIVEKGECVFSKGFGQARMGIERTPMTSDTIMSIQSVSKNFMAVSILSLCEKNLIHLDDPLVQYLPYFETTDSCLSKKITVRHVLSHTAGFPSDLGVANMKAPNIRDIYSDTETEFNEALEYYGLSEEELLRIHSREDITRWFKKVQLKYPPGEGWAYCTDSYVILCDLFEKVSGITWEEYLSSYLFKELKMDRTLWDPMIAEGDRDSSWYYMDSPKIKTPYPINPLAAPIGFLYSSANDLGKYLQFHISELGGGILKRSSILEMQKPVIKVPAHWYPEGWGYGLGWFTGSYKNEPVVEHGGGQMGVRSMVSILPARQSGIAVLMNTNGNGHRTVNRTIMDMLLE
ncbi:serine hydrolase domain-containing protein [Peribacillus kribbensis]|uniref:serine hydrolase domain-containing protein n=1 Tax=Peribacillus kribbensis TaxID=356658 RepID=UPI000422124A|nr:serine hydrolase domain-containing protein [Peribacillus kribbensis]